MDPGRPAGRARRDASSRGGRVVSGVGPGAPAGRVHPPARHQTRDREHRRGQDVLVAEHRGIRRIGESLAPADHHNASRQQLQRSAPRHREQPAPATTDPHNQSALGRPYCRREVGAQRERHRDSAEQRAEARIGCGQLAAPLTQPVGGCGQRAADRCQRQSADGQAVLKMPDRQVLEAESHERRAQHERLHPKLGDVGGASLGEHDRNRQVEQHQHRDQWLHRRPAALVESIPQPVGRYAESEGVAQQVELGPDLEPRHRDDAGAQDREEAEHHHVVVGARVRQHRGEEPADDAQHRQSTGVLGNAEDSRAGRDHDDHRHDRRGRDQVVDTEGRVRGHMQHRDRAALQAPSERGPPVPLEPAHRQQQHRRRGDGDEAHLDGRHGDVALRGLRDQQPRSDHSEHNARPRRGVSRRHPLSELAGEPRHRIEQRQCPRPDAGGCRRRHVSDYQQQHARTDERGRPTRRAGLCEIDEEAA